MDHAHHFSANGMKVMVGENHEELKPIEAVKIISRQSHTFTVLMMVNIL